MSWGRGLFRLWIVLAGLWCILIGASLWQWTFGPRYYYPEHYFSATTPVRVDVDTPNLADEMAAMKASGQVDQAVIDGYDEAKFYFPVGMSEKDVSNIIDTLVVPKTKQARSDYDRTTTIANLPGFAGALFLPPFVALVLGLAGAWVVRGFRRS